MIYKHLVFINVLIFALPILVDSTLGLDSTAFIISQGSAKGFATGLFSPYQLITSSFLHANTVHLFVNMLALGYSIGPDVNKIYKNLRFIVIYFVSAVSGSLLSVIFQDNPYGSVGASGAIMGLVGSLMAFAFKTRQWSVFWSVTFMILLNFYFGIIIPNIDNFGHLGGLVAGFVIGYFMITPKIKSPRVYQKNFSHNIIDAKAIPQVNS